MNVNLLKKALGCIVEPLAYWTLYPFSAFHFRKRNIHLISERGTEARDNGYAMFRYYRTTHPEIECYYVITNDSPDRRKVEALGNVVRYRSLKHYCLFFGAKYKISTHLWGCAPHNAFYTRLSTWFPVQGKRISLKHGITKEDLCELYAEKAQLSLLISGAKPEYEYMKETFHYKGNEIRYTGFARYDGLHDARVKRQILVMPTWRAYLNKVSRNKIAHSDYVKAWNGLLHNDRLINALERYDIELLFYPHYQMQPYLDLFASGSDRIIIASFEHYDVQTLLKESALLVTDYSSVYFDFAYMMKPSVFYQFDIDAYYSMHRKKGYFDFETMGFGPVYQEEKALVDEVIGEIECDFAFQETYQKRAEEFFPLRDTHNCERIFEAIESL